MRICGACEKEIACAEDNILQCGHDAHAACLIERSGGRVETIACPTCNVLLFKMRVYGLNGIMALVLYMYISARGAWQAISPFLVVFLAIQFHRIIDWLF